MSPQTLGQEYTSARVALDATVAVVEQEVDDQKAERLKEARIANAHRSRRKRAMKKEHGHTYPCAQMALYRWCSSMLMSLCRICVCMVVLTCLWFPAGLAQDLGVRGGSPKCLQSPIIDQLILDEICLEPQAMLLQTMVCIACSERLSLTRPYKQRRTITPKHTHWACIAFCHDQENRKNDLLDLRDDTTKWHVVNKDWHSGGPWASSEAFHGAEGVVRNNPDDFHHRNQVEQAACDDQPGWHQRCNGPAPCEHPPCMACEVWGGARFQ